jgi:hypothetical protein
MNDQTTNTIPFTYSYCIFYKKSLFHLGFKIMTMEMESIQEEKREEKGKGKGAKGRYEERRYV